MEVKRIYYVYEVMTVPVIEIKTSGEHTRVFEVTADRMVELIKVLKMYAQAGGCVLMRRLKLVQGGYCSAQS